MTFSQKLPKKIEALLGGIDSPGLVTGDNQHAKGKAAAPKPFVFDPASYIPPDPAKIPPREWLYDRYFIRGVVSATLGAPGRGKSTKEMTDAISMATGLDLMDKKRPLDSGPLRVAYINGEENQDELDRRFAAISEWYKIKPEQYEGRIWIISTRDKPMRLAIADSGGAGVIVEEVVAALEAFADKNKLDVLIFDPVVSFHRIREGDSGDMDMLYKEGFGRIAGKTRAVDLAIHPRKPAPGALNTTMDDLRGSSAQEGAIRAARILNFMTSTEATKLGIDEDQRRLHIRIDGGKNNPGPIAAATWLKLEVANLPNGDAVAVATPWNPPNHFKGVTTAQMKECRKAAQGGAYRADIQAKDWFGYKVAEIIKTPLKPGGERDKAAFAKVSAIIKKWLDNDVLAIEEREAPGQRKTRKFIVPGPNNLSQEFDDDMQLSMDG
jgi:AAA domain